MSKSELRHSDCTDTVAMPRTPLLRSILEMARNHTRARVRGLPVEAVVEGQSRVSRRAFLAGAGAATAALALPRRLLAAGSPRIAIVGAGISGLSCALTLADAGIASTVYEGSGRIGGRMFSNSTYWD